MPRVTHHPPGNTATKPQAGDILLTGVRSQGIYSWAIKAGSWLRRYEAPYRRFSHAVLVVSEDGSIVEALTKGVARGNLAKYDADDYVLVRVGVDAHDQAQVLAFAESVLAARTRYGFATILGLALFCLSGAQLCIQWAGTAICSGFVCDALTRAGYIWPRPPFAMMPADLARYFDVHADPAG
ncbi:MAG TPA: hypothetical protein VHZ75_08640 [Solirubrobacteraceae bacterium]|jgi:hypothetical protein|nr:hypothetical protein [Solirubrobacteraceae bacterium]